MQGKFREITFTDADVVNMDDWIPAGECNPRNVRPFLFHDHGFTIGIVFADCLQDALDELADSGRIDSLKVDFCDSDDQRDYGMVKKVDAGGNEYWDIPEDSRLACLGNHSEFYDIESLGIEELPNPARSFVAQFNTSSTSN